MYFLAFDTEDDSAELIDAGKSGFKKKITQIACRSNDGVDEYYSKGNVKTFKTWLKTFPKGTVAYAHNLQYDLGNIFGDEIDKLDVTMVGGRMIKARWGNITFRDSFNLWPMGLKKVGESFGIEKKKFNARSKAYVWGDVEITIAAMNFTCSLASEYGLEGLPSTLGGLSVAIWRKMGGDNWHDSFELSRRGIYGGRVELFSTGGKGNIYYTDINSLYPSVMLRQFPMEAGLMNDIDGFGVADVTIKIPKSFIMSLPVRREDGSIYYPYGTIRGVWTFHEIQNAIANGGKLKQLHEAYGSKEGYNYYADYVNHFYLLRKNEKSDARRVMYKFLMNNLYGQLAMSGEITRSLQLDETTLGKGTAYGVKCLCKQQVPLPEHVNYLHAAYVTSYGRLELQRYLRQLGEGQLIYCDTDSVIFFCEDKPPFEISDELGKMKIEGVAGRCLTYGPKCYDFGGDVKAKGVRKALAKQFVETGAVEFAQPFKFRESVQFYDRNNSKRLSVWRLIEKHFKSEYDKKKLIDGIYYPLQYSANA